MKYSESLKKNRDFQLVYREGTSYANRHLVMYVRKTGWAETGSAFRSAKKWETVWCAII